MAPVNRIRLWESTHLERSPGQCFILKTVFAQVQLSPLYFTHTDLLGGRIDLHCLMSVMAQSSVHTLWDGIYVPCKHPHMCFSACGCLHLLVLYHAARGTYQIYHSSPILPSWGKKKEINNNNNDDNNNNNNILMFISISSGNRDINRFCWFQSNKY